MSEYYQRVPITLKEAQGFVAEHHRHNIPPVGHKFSVGLKSNGELIGVAIAGRPVSRILDDGKTLEILRVCVEGYHKNANSILYAACVKAGKALGYTTIITYTLESETGSSLLATGFAPVAHTAPRRGWDTPSRPREKLDKYPTEGKIRWEHK